MTKFLIVGTGGVGGSIGGFLALAGEDVTCIARGAHLEALQANGLHLKSTLKGDHYVPVKAVTAEDYADRADVIFVCVKQYSLESIKEILVKASHPETVIIPILNVYGTGESISKMTGLSNVIDGCIYIVGYVSGAGEISQDGNVFNIIFGNRKDSHISPAKLESIAQKLIDSGVHVRISPDIERDTFIKWSFISAMACTGAYYDATVQVVQNGGEARELYAGLARESGEIGEKLGIAFDGGIEGHVAFNLSVMDKLDPSSTASMQKDLAKGGQSEIQGLLFDMIQLGCKVGVNMPFYEKVSAKLSRYKNA